MRGQDTPDHEASASVSDGQQARQFGKIYWDEPGSPAAKVIAAYVRYRCYSGPRVILRAELQSALGLGPSATKRAIAEAIEAGLIERRPSLRPGDTGQYVYSDGCAWGPESNPGGSEIDRGGDRNRTPGGRKMGGQNRTPGGRKSTGGGSKSNPGGSKIDRPMKVR